MIERVAVLLLVAVASCRPSPGSARLASPAASATKGAAAGHGGSERLGRWVAWAGPGRISGSFVTAEGAGPIWSVDVAGSAQWSDDGRWLTTCASGFVAARWMGSAQPSRIAVLNGGCESLNWAPRGQRALALAKASNQARLLSFSEGEQPSMRATSFEIGLAAGERLYDRQYFQWSPTGDSFLVTVLAASRGLPVRWVDVGRTPGTVRKLVTPNGFEAQANCWWAPGGRRFACRSFAPAPAPTPKPDARNEPREALSLFEIDGGEVSGRTLFEAPWFALSDLSWLDADHLVFQDRDATRLVDVTGAEPPITLSATAGNFAVSPTAPRVAYVNHRGLCLRSAADKLGPERLLAAGQLKGVSWSSDGRHLLTHVADARAVLVVTDAASDKSRVQRTTDAPPGLMLGASFSAGGTVLLTRVVTGKPTLKETQPLQVWSLSDFAPRRFLPDGFYDQWFAESPDDAALVARRDDESAALYLGRVRSGRTTFAELGEGGGGGWVRWQPGSAIAVSETPAPQQPSDPYRQRVAVPPTHPFSFGTASVVGSRECSGALIDPYYLVTAHHCVEDSNRSVQVVLGRGLAWQREYSVPHYRILHHPKLHYVEGLDLFEYDLALIELPEPAPAQARPFALARAQDGAAGSEVWLAGYGGDRSLGLSAQPELRYGISRLVPVAGIAGALAWRSAEGAENAGCFGDSGGPVLVRQSDGRFALLAIHFGSGGTDYTRACGNDGVAGNLVAERAWLNEALDKLSVSRRGSGAPAPRPHPL